MNLEVPAPDIEHLLRELAPQVLGTVARRHGDFEAAEDAVQEALIAAAEQWKIDGIPENPPGWLYHVAMRRFTDTLRSEMARQRREDQAGTEMLADWAFVPGPDAEFRAEDDDSIVLLFMCCHPTLSESSQIALTLRAVGGLTTAEIASAFFVPEATMAQRISRAKQSIKTSDVPFSMPTDSEREERLRAVLHVLYLIFSEGYASAGPTLSRTDLSNEAIRLARGMHALLPGEEEVAGLLSLMLLTDARRAARTGPRGELIPLDEQDRSLWNQALIAEGTALLSETMPKGKPGYYQIQAAVAAVHDEAASADVTDWKQILALYATLKSMTDNPMVSLSHAIAAAMVDGPRVGMELIDALEKDPRIAGSYRLEAVRAHLYEMLGNKTCAIASYRAAAERATSIQERNYLMKKGATVRN